MKVDDIAPDFEAVNELGQRVTLSELLDDGPVVLFFYPGAFTPGCTAEACHFRDLAAEFRSAGATVVGISGDRVPRQARFAASFRLGFPLLSDEGGTIAREFGVRRPGFLPNARTTFVIDTDRRVLSADRNELNMNGHADRALALLRNRPTS